MSIAAPFGLASGVYGRCQGFGSAIFSITKIMGCGFITLLLAALAFSFTSLSNPGIALAVDCIGVPQVSTGGGTEATFFDGDAGTCQTKDRGGVAPTNSFRVLTDDDDAIISTLFFGSFDDWANCTVTVSHATVTLKNSIFACDAGKFNGRIHRRWHLRSGMDADGIHRPGRQFLLLKINITATATVDHTINSMSITGGADQ